MKGKCPIIMWFPAPISSFMGVLGPENMGGHGDLAAKIEATARELGKTPVEVADLVGTRTIYCKPGNSLTFILPGVQEIRRESQEHTRIAAYV